MGTFTYADIDIDIDDRLLAHLEAVILAKLRLQQSFFFTWTNPVQAGSGRHCIWLDPAIPLVFLYASGARPRLNREWAAKLLESANTEAGIVYQAEPGGPVQASPSRIRRRPPSRAARKQNTTPAPARSGW
jgi:hypothetical protein